MSCSDNTCCSNEYQSDFNSIDDVEKRSSKLFRPSIPSGQIKIRTRFHPLNKTFDLSVNHNLQKNQTCWDATARGSIHEYVAMESKFVGLDKSDIKFMFHHPKIANTTAAITASFNAKNRTVAPKLNISKAFRHSKIQGNVAFNLPTCETESICALNRARCEMSAVFFYPKIRAGIKLITQNIRCNKDMSHHYSASYTEGPVIATISTTSFQNFNGSVIYRVDPSLSIGVQSNYNKNSKIYQTHAAFYKKVHPRTKFIVIFNAIKGRVSSDLDALLTLKHRVSDSITFNVSNEFSLEGNTKPAKFGFGLEFNA
ncbi:LOW QUALITY PROTEIN: hypothetical protein HZS_6379 [Henneguya salminicola]|nr:LOW QUALITY PROTEIN: hypothetical protein HZS_6379 [Henneguya salminicola]